MAPARNTFAYNSVTDFSGIFLICKIGREQIEFYYLGLWYVYYKPDEVPPFFFQDMFFIYNAN
jgi:hypothetical protein